MEKFIHFIDTSKGNFNFNIENDRIIFNSDNFLKIFNHLDLKYPPESNFGIWRNPDILYVKLSQNKILEYEIHAVN